MPELPEVETVCRGLAARLEGRRLTRLELRRPNMRFPFPTGLSALVEGRRVETIRRRAKYILMTLDDGGVLIAHLGMSGRMTIGPAEGLVLEPHDHVVFETEDGTAVRFNDARRFGFLDYCRAEDLPRHKLFAELGPEPLGNEFSGPILAKKLAGKLTSIKAALLDQKIVAGLGNIYVSESLYWAQVSPMRLSATILAAEADTLVAAIRQVLLNAIAAGGSSLRDYVQATGELGYFQHQWAVYGKEGEPCPDCTCTQGIERIVQSNRSTFYCARRQH
ncbi:MAG TPA: bifunctional DNA-formamidopyrimidine glycosylase/DNA-(apurinic or apyrimidinic site) lyase [Aliidongia sp.]|uniref:bifunctional DNA-formamidopyrimidine glycosylase/DNA-(apurinic or apyrimidinic site) lyase n=1 Tax=Aliidongia sp. TaxID=1914230 RepID=UPI002DDD4E87|nr:bifunctional DNA-formamidopyrimidine glycosylase/DNA-(apurinic or apyrimidinic site) lyase [Aliidongia sp.]HEV2677872.1 bifunctional DNA-formamidopyrimidine glycosylase/DNA-(apurinic or apyrimidinic site) lyase [Aliidongia sp.]